MEKFCLDCQKLLVGRADKKFCDDQCRTSYNNRLKIQDHSLMKQINQVLKKNYQILQRFNPDGKSKVRREILLQNGFNFNYHTHTYTTQKGVNYIFCYEYGYLLLENDEVLLVKREEK